MNFAGFIKMEKNKRTSHIYQGQIKVSMDVYILWWRGYIPRNDSYKTGKAPNWHCPSNGYSGLVVMANFLSKSRIHLDRAGRSARDAKT